MQWLLRTFCCSPSKEDLVSIYQQRRDAFVVRAARNVIDSCKIRMDILGIDEAPPPFVNIRLHDLGIPVVFRREPLEGKPGGPPQEEDVPVNDLAERVATQVRQQMPHLYISITCEHTLDDYECDRVGCPQDTMRVVFVT